MCVYPFGQRSLWLAYEKIPLSLPSFYIGNPNICKHKKIQKKLKNGPCHCKTGQKDNKKKYKNKKKCVEGGGGGAIFSTCSV